jgi:hypothetical protein
VMFLNDPADWVAHLYRLRWVIVVGLLCIMGTIAGCVFALQIKSKKVRHWLQAVLLLLAIITTCALWVHAAGKEMLVTLLGAEEDRSAEEAYLRLEKRAGIGWLISYANDKREDDNIRFYMSRMLGLRIRQGVGSTNILMNLSCDPIHPSFFDQNNLNQDVKVIPTPLTPRTVAKYYAEKAATESQLGVRSIKQ